MQSRCAGEFNRSNVAQPHKAEPKCGRSVCLLPITGDGGDAMGSRFPFSGFARRFRTDVETLFCRHIRGGPSLSARALALDRIAGSLCLVCSAVIMVWLANLALPAGLLQVPLIGESAQAAAPDAESEAPGAQATTRQLSAGDIRTLQSRLKSLGFDPGAIDGIAGPRTLQALNLYRASMKLEHVSYVDRSTVADLTE
jgi:hypothetical protein